MRLRHVGLFAVFCLTASCDSTDPPVPTSISVTPGSATLTSLGATQQLSAQVLDQSGNALTGQTVTYTSAPSSVATVSSTGLVTAVGNGTATVTVSSGSLSTPVTVTVAVSPGSLARFAGNGQIAMQGTALTTPIQAVTRTSGGSALPGVTVTFAVTSGGGSVNPTSAVTNAQGIAQTTWTVGTASVIQTVTATVAGLTPVSFSGNGLPAAAANFQVSVVNIGPPFSAAVQSAFDAAAAFWQSAITGDLANITGFFTNPGECNAPNATPPVDIDDVLIMARFDSIDGPSQVLGSAGPCFIRTTGRLTIAGSMRFDTADVATLISNGSLNAVIRHEMGHVLGFGTLWTQAQFNCLQLSSSAGNVQDTHFNCPTAVAQFNAMGGATYSGNKVPVENCGPASPASCGPGTVNGHWREPTFANELMTGYLNGGAPNPASALTIAAMQDLGYVVNNGAAESYTCPAACSTLMASLQAFAGPVLDLRDDIHRGPIYLMERNGRITGVVLP